MAAKTTKKSTIRKVKVLRFTIKHGLKDVEEKVNNAIDILAEAGNKIVTITTVVAGSSPVYILYNIIYEPTADVAAAEGAE